ncbi:ATP-binding domain-containing protein [Schlegelella sp. S2-27]|uniref:DNA 3'-5' helicase II n=1 Tax=Caldimonas mangrovi TaxID=2944811 RepID=A0ABT0YN85_9BURK|nr:ATP-binding domain-containing protein [Caldimonas mangrovi]MCM5680113.1 ATP-binding domain-containing protein [Caldimonas mangrovi]
MTVWAVNGAAGFGKTYRLLQRTTQELQSCPLGPGQAVLALTFMHGARQRLEQKLQAIPGLRGKYQCVTVDGFARSLRWRWRSLANAMGQPSTDAADFDSQCSLAADLVQRPVVGSWLAMGYPCILLDEAQDLDLHRLRLVEALSAYSRLLIAFDDFQCLRQDLRPSPASVWLPTVCEPEVLAKPQRCKVPALLDASTALRSGLRPVAGAGFKIAECASASQAAALIAATIHYAKLKSPNSSVAVITPSRKGGYAEELVELVSTKQCGKQKLGPFKLNWELGESPFLESVEQLAFDGEKPCRDVLHALLDTEEGLARDALVRWVIRKRDVAGREYIRFADLLGQARRVLAVTRARANRSDSGRRALTVHQAKNREFDIVIVVWPYTVAQDDEGKRRLLYNAVTRAKLQCTVIVQGIGSTGKAPFG